MEIQQRIPLGGKSAAFESNNTTEDRACSRFSAVVRTLEKGRNIYVTLVPGKRVPRAAEAVQKNGSDNHWEVRAESPRNEQRRSRCSTPTGPRLTFASG